MDRTKLKTLVEQLLVEYHNSKARGEERRLSEYHSALPLGVVTYLWFFLQPDGQLLAFNLLHDEVTASFGDDLTLTYAVRLGSKRYTEFESLLPHRPVDSVNCDSCLATGKTPTEDWDPCSECYGRGWLEKEVHDLIKHTAGILGNSIGNHQQTIETVNSFLDQGHHMNLLPTTLITYFGNVIKLLDVDKTHRQSLLDILEESGREHFDDQWPE